MSGIFGAVDTSRKLDLVSICQDSLNILLHEKWYKRMTVGRDDACLGAVSTAPGFSPDSNILHTEDFIVVVEGYGFIVDGETFCERDGTIAKTVLKLYLEEGDFFARRLSGSFNIAIFEQKKRKLLVTNDRTAFKHLFYYKDQNIFMFSPEMKSFLAYNQLDKTIDEAAMAVYFASDCCISDTTHFEKIKLMPPASVMTLVHGEFTIVEYWRPNFQADESCTSEKFIEKGVELFRRSIQNVLPEKKYDKIFFPLSGGLDSRLLLKLCEQHHDSLVVYTHGWQGCLDYKIAKKVAEGLGLASQHQLIEIKPSSMTDNAIQAVWLNEGQVAFRNAYLIGISRELGPGPYPFINGIIGAYLSLGTGHYLAKSDIKVITDESVMKKDILGFLQFSHLSYFLKDSVAKHFQGLSRDLVWSKFQEHRYPELYCDQKFTYLSTHYLGRRRQGVIDVHKTYFHDVLPFVDDQLYELFCSIPSDLKCGHGLYQEMLKASFPDLARFPWGDTGHNLFTSAKELKKTSQARARRHRLRKFVQRASHGWVNLNNPLAYQNREIWLRQDKAFRDVVFPVLREAKDLKLDYFSQEKIDSLIKAYDNGNFWLFPVVAKLFTFLTWYRLFVLGEYKDRVV